MSEVLLVFSDPGQRRAMSFANPILLFGLFAMAIPPLVQLLARRRHDEVHWGAMQFLRLTPRARRRLQFEEWLLLALRMAALGLLALALAGPVIRSRLFVEVESRRPRATVLLIDCSGSMNRKHEGRAAIDVAKDWAAKFLKEARAGDRVALFAVKGDLIPIAGSMTADLESVQSSLGLLPPPRGTADWPGAVEAAIKLLAGARESAEIVVISDGQRFGWSDGETAARWELLARTVAAAEEERPRIWVLNAASGWPTVMGAPSLLTLRANRSVATASAAIAFECGLQWEGAAEPPRVRLEIDGRAAGEVSLPPTAQPGAPTAIRFSRRFSPGSHIVTLRLGADRRDFALDVLPSIPVLVVAGDENSGGRFLRDALAPSRDPSPAFAVKSVPWTQFIPEQLKPDTRGADSAPRLVIFANVPRITADQSSAVERFLSEGGGVLVAPGDQTEPEQWNRVAYRNGHGWLPARLMHVLGSESAIEAAPRPRTAGFEHPAVRIFRDPLPGGLQTAYFPRYWKLEPDAVLPDSATVGRLTNGDPFLVEKPVGRGHAMIAAVPLGNSWRTNLIALPDFVRLAHELAYYLATVGSAANLAPGDPIVFRPPVDEPPGPVALMAPDNRSRVLPAAAWPVRFAATHEPGDYKLTTPRGRTQFFAVQQDPRESDLTPWKDTDQPKGWSGALEYTASLDELHERRGRGPAPHDFAGLLFFFVLAFLATELWYTRKLVARGS
jgi:Mg-chelatase subunit ChlD